MADRPGRANSGPVLSLCWASLLLGERLSWTTVLGGLAVMGCAGIAVRTRAGSPVG